MVRHGKASRAGVVVRLLAGTVDVLLGAELDMLVFDVFPLSIGGHDIARAAPADANIIGFERIGEVDSDELAALICIMERH